MDRATFDRETAVHRKLYEALRDQIKGDHAGKYIALAGGRFIAATSTYAEARAAVGRLGPVPEYHLIFPAGEEPAFRPGYDVSEFADPGVRHTFEPATTLASNRAGCAVSARFG